MHPQAGEAAAREGAAALGALVLVVREQQVGAAAMDVEIGAEIAPRHCAALDVPTRAAAAPRTLPARQLGRRGLPQHEVARIALVVGDLYSGAGEQLLRVAPRQRAVARVRGDGEQHVAGGRVGMAAGDQPLDHFDHLGDVRGRARLDVGRQDVECGEVGLEVRVGARGQARDRLAQSRGAGVDLVVDIGDVAHVGDERIEPA